MTHDEMIAAIQADKDGKPIQWKWKGSKVKWEDTADPLWNFADCDYRPKPKPRLLYMPEYESGLLYSFYTDIESAKKYHSNCLRIVTFVEQVDD